MELKFDELSDSLNDIKNKVLENFESSLFPLFEYNDDINKDLNERVIMFEDILSRIGEIQQNSESANEDLLEFFFNNHKEFEEKLVKDKTIKHKVDNC